MTYDPSKKYAAIKKSAFDLAHKHGARRTATLIARGASPLVIIKSALDDADVPAIVATIYTSEREEWEDGEDVRFPKLTPYQANKLAEAILKLEPPALRVLWIYRALLDAPGFKGEQRAKLFDAFVKSEDWLFLPDALQWIPDLSPEERTRLEKAIGELPVDDGSVDAAAIADQIFPKPEAD